MLQTARRIIAWLFLYLLLHYAFGSLNELLRDTIRLNTGAPSLESWISAYVEPALMEAKGYDSFQFVRNGYFCADCKDSTKENPVFNRIVSLKSSFKLPK